MPSWASGQLGSGSKFLWTGRLQVTLDSKAQCRGHGIERTNKVWCDVFGRFPLVAALSRCESYCRCSSRSSESASPSVVLILNNIYGRVICGHYLASSSMLRVSFTILARYHIDAWKDPKLSG